ncbi:MAG UNVERIFIED_CONTAM: hypothetical protein LVT10_26825 [Anaerolineae bacterium]
MNKFTEKSFSTARESYNLFIPPCQANRRGLARCPHARRYPFYVPCEPCPSPIDERVAGATG